MRFYTIAIFLFLINLLAHLFTQVDFFALIPASIPYQASWSSSIVSATPTAPNPLMVFGDFLIATQTFFTVFASALAYPQHFLVTILQPICNAGLISQTFLDSLALLFQLSTYFIYAVALIQMLSGRVIEKGA